jgi:hypothetical protein
MDTTVKEKCNILGFGLCRKVKFSLCLIKHYAMKTYGEGICRLQVSSQLQAPAVLPRGIHWIGEWVGPRAGLEEMEK